MSSAAAPVSSAPSLSCTAQTISLLLAKNQLGTKVTWREEENTAKTCYSPQKSFSMPQVYLEASPIINVSLGLSSSPYSHFQLPQTPTAHMNASIQLVIPGQVFCLIFIYF